MRGWARTVHFRTRLTVALLSVAAGSAGLLALTSLVVIREYRLRSFTTDAERQVRLSLISANEPVSPASFAGLLAEYQRRGGFHTVVLDGELALSSLASLGREDIPKGMPGELGMGKLVRRTTQVDGRPYLVIGGVPRIGSARFFFFFPQEQLLDGLAEFRNILLLGWLLAIAASTLVAQGVARRTLRPVRAAADAAQGLAEGLLQTRLSPESNDEFGAWAQTFNRMADALEARIDALAEVAERERQFTSDVAHELRTPLSGMVSAASLLEGQLCELEARQRRPAELLINDVRRLQRLVIDLLELARLDAGQAEVRLEPLSVEAALRSIAAWGNAPSVTISVDEGLWAEADRARFRLVVANLVANAIDHGKDQVEVRAVRRGEEAVIEVLDRGPGIPGGDLERIFHRFYKGDRSRSASGSGLGLAIAFENARAQGGRLEAANREGGGACFTFSLSATEPVEE